MVSTAASVNTGLHATCGRRTITCNSTAATYFGPRFSSTSLLEAGSCCLPKPVDFAQPRRDLFQLTKMRPPPSSSSSRWLQWPAWTDRRPTTCVDLRKKAAGSAVDHDWRPSLSRAQERRRSPGPGSSPALGLKTGGATRILRDSGTCGHGPASRWQPNRLTKAFGYADLRFASPGDQDTIFHLASLTQPFAAVVLLQWLNVGN
jgi:hypothetical protein